MANNTIVAFTSFISFCMDNIDTYNNCVGSVMFELTIVRSPIWDKNIVVGYAPTGFILSSNNFVTRHVYDWHKNYD